MVPGSGTASCCMMSHPERTKPIAGAILAGGMARRMGGADKAALHVGGCRIIDHQLAVLQQATHPVFIVSSRPDALTGLAGNPRVLADVLPNAGPLGGIYTAIVRSPHARTLVVACDMPFLTLPLVELLTADSDADVVLPRSEAGVEPLCATWSRAAADVIRRRIERGQLQAGGVVEDLKVEEIGPARLAECDPTGRLFVNVNTPHDYERARELMRVKPGE